MIAIHPLTTHEEILAVEQIQRDVWGVPDVEVVPLHLLITAAKNGGLLLGAFDGERLAGFVFGFLGLTADGRLKHCSHMAGVHPDYRDQGLGYQLKLAQRAHVLALGIDLVTWTFDPLETRNAQLNFHKLGALCNTYLRNLYGDMRDGLNAGLPSDRFQVDWWVGSQQVAERLRVEEAPPSSIAPAAPRLARDASADQMMLEVPAHFQTIKQTDMPLAMQWRLRTRQRFEDAFSQGYTVTDLLRHDDRCHYLLKRL